MKISWLLPLCIGLVLGFGAALLIPAAAPVLYGAPAGEAPAAPPPREARLDLNSATKAQLDELPGIGPALAQHILQHREAYGPFQTVWELNAVDGLGESIINGLIPYVTVSEKE